METVVHDGRETAYRHTRADSEGPTVLYVHGSGGNHRLWGHQYAPRGPDHPAVALDLSGHGDSADIDSASGPATLSAYAEDVRAVARETDTDVLVGNSLGGAVVFEGLLTGRVDPDGIVLAGTGAKLAVHERLRELLAEDFDSAIATLHEQGRLFFDVTDQIREQSVDAMRAAGQSVTRRDFLTCHQFDIRDRLDAITTPALAVVGEHDELTPVTYHEYLAAELPDCELQVLDGAAHLAMLEQPAAFNRAITQFLEKL